MLSFSIAFAVFMVILFDETSRRKLSLCPVMALPIPVHSRATGAAKRILIGVLDWFMASAAANVSTGLTITFASSFFLQITNVDWSGISRPSIKTSHMGTAAPAGGTFGNDTFIPGDLSDPGSLEVEFNFNPDTLPPIDSAAATCTVTIPGSATPAAWAGSAFMTEMNVAMPLEDLMVGKGTLKFSGAITRTAGA